MLGPHRALHRDGSRTAASRRLPAPANASPGRGLAADRDRRVLEPQDGKQQPLGATAAAACTLNSSPAHARISITYPGYTIEYKNVFGIVLVRKDMGGQQAGVTCFVNGAGQCVSSGFGFSTASSCFGNLG